MKSNLDNLELAQKALVEEFTNSPYTCDHPLGNAASSRKIQEYVIACVDAKDTCMWDWFETNIIEEFNVKGVEKEMLEFARDVLERSQLQKKNGDD